MVGKKQFEEDAVIDTAMRVFWERGYGATSMGDLAEATGVQRGSLYNAYAGKEALLIRSLDRYAAEQGGPVRGALEHPDLAQSITQFFQSHLDRMENKDNPAGCLMCQTALECAGDPVVSEYVQAAFLRTENALFERLRKGREEGVLPETAEPRALARFILGVSRGMAVLHRAYGEMEPVRDMARVANTFFASSLTQASEK